MDIERSINLGRLYVFVILFAFWLIFSGHYDAFHLAAGVVCAALVAHFSSDLLLPDERSTQELRAAWRFLRYVPWLVSRIVLANLHVVYLIFRPHQIRPQVVRLKTGLTSSFPIVTLGNSITLTPGTITMDIADGEVFVHAISDASARDLATGELERRVAHIFAEPTSAAPPPPGSEP